jgi:hypothetical protein
MASVQNQILQASTALTAATTNGTGVSLGVGDTDFCTFINVSACNGATTVAAKIQHSPDNSNWVDLVSFTSIVGATGTECKDITVHVMPYVRSVVALSGVTKAATVSIHLFYDRK